MMKRLIFAAVLAAFSVPAFGDVDLTPTETDALTIAVQREENLRLSVVNLQLQLEIVKARYAEAMKASQATFTDVCKAHDVDPATAKPSADLKKLEVPE